MIMSGVQGALNGLSPGIYQDAEKVVGIGDVLGSTRKSA
jgi:hypothetical protein